MDVVGVGGAAAQAPARPNNSTKMPPNLAHIPSMEHEMKPAVRFRAVWREVILVGWGSSAARNFVGTSSLRGEASRVETLELRADGTTMVRRAPEAILSAGAYRPPDWRDTVDRTGSWEVSTGRRSG